MAEAVEGFVPDFARVEGEALAGKFVRSYWQPIGLAREFEIAKPKRVQAVGNHYTVYRGEDGEVRVMQDRCPHRGTSLAYGWVEGNCIRCRYHGWQFDGEGKGREFPAETKTYAEKISLKTYPVREYLGLIFAYLGEGEPPAFTRFEELEDESRGELLSQVVVLPYNFFQRIENDHDEVHTHYTHKFMTSFGIDALPRMSARETEYGMVSVASRTDGSRFEAHGFMPNILLRQVPIQQDQSKMAIHLAWRVPIDNTTTMSFTVNRVETYSDEMRQRMIEIDDYVEISDRLMNCEMTLEDVDPEHPLLAVIQDTVSIGGQGEIVDRNQENLGQSDLGVAVLRRVWAREMKAIAEGRSVTRFYRPEGFLYQEKLAAVV